MFRLILILLSLLAAGALLALAETVRGPLVRIVRAALAGLAAILAVAGAAILILAFANEAWWAAVVGVAALAVAARLGWKLRRRRYRSEQQAPDHVPLTRPADAPQWQRFEACLDWVGRKQARRAHTAIAGFLAERDSQSLNHDHRALLLSCDKRVPELIETCLDRCRNAAPDERDRYMDETLETLVRIGEEAARARREVREADDRRLSTLRRYFDGIAAPDDRGR